MDESKNALLDQNTDMSDTDINASKFAESYASFSRIINNLQRQYIELKDEFSTQNEKLAESNRKLIELTESNLSANQFLNGILASIPVGVITIDRLGVVTHLNQAGSIILNTDPRKAVGRPYAEIIPTVSDSTPGALNAVQTGQQVTSVEKALELDENRKLRVSVSTAILKDENGMCTGAVEVFQDLTKIRRLEHEIARLNTLAALGEMAATIAHEVRNPLSGIGGFAALLERDFEPHDPKVALIQKIKKGVESLNSTVTKLLNYTRFNELNRSDTNFVSYLKSSIEQFKHDERSSGREVRVVLDDIQHPRAADITVSIDKILFRQCLYNIMSNSIDAVGEGVQINIAAKLINLSEITPEFSNKVTLDFDELLLVTTISDNGPGIKAEHRDKIFAPFFTTKNSGSGLGLAVAWKLIKAHGGEIVLDENSAGAIFHILMPARTEKTYLENDE